MRFLALLVRRSQRWAQAARLRQPARPAACSGAGGGLPSPTAGSAPQQQLLAAESGQPSRALRGPASAGPDVCAAPGSAESLPPAPGTPHSPAEGHRAVPPPGLPAHAPARTRAAMPCCCPPRHGDHREQDERLRVPRPLLRSLSSAAQRPREGNSEGDRDQRLSAGAQLPAGTRGQTSRTQQLNTPEQLRRMNCAQRHWKRAMPLD